MTDGAERPPGPSAPEQGQAGAETPPEGGLVTAGPAAGLPSRGRRWALSRNHGVAALFLLPALVLLGALVVYPILFTIVRSFYDRAGDDWVGLDNYRQAFTNERTRTALTNNLVWVAIAPTLATILGLGFAVMAERVRWQTAFKVAVFMPMAISFLAAGVIFRLVYQTEPELGLANAVVTAVGDIFEPPGEYLGARPADEELLAPEGEALRTTTDFEPGDEVNLGLLAIRPDDLPDEAQPAEPADPGDDAIGGVVWLDFSRGGGGERGVVDASELGLPGVKVEVVADGSVAGRATTDDDGAWTVDGLDPGRYQVRLAASNFSEPFEGFNWLGRDLVTAATIAAFLWIWAGFAMIVIGAGLAAIPRDVLEAARVDGAGEWQVFRRVTVPLLMPVLLVVLVTLAINVLKIFDLVLIIPPGEVQDDANVIAVEMWRVSFGGRNDQGLGSALSVLLFLLVAPAMAFNIKRLRSEG
ncbi:sugar ABC transporter permease [soil metagenome]